MNLAHPCIENIEKTLKENKIDAKNISFIFDNL